MTRKNLKLIEHKTTYKTLIFIVSLPIKTLFLQGKEVREKEIEKNKKSLELAYYFGAPAITS